MLKVFLFCKYLFLTSLDPTFYLFFLRLQHQKVFGERMLAVMLFVLLENLPVAFYSLFVHFPWVDKWELGGVLIHPHCYGLLNTL